MFLIFILLLLINIVLNLNGLIASIYKTLNTWFYNVLPSIFIFYNISNYLISNKIILFVSKIFKFIIKFESQYSYSLLFINIFLGNPGTTSLINEAFNNNKISINDYRTLNSICIYMNPLFVITFFNIKFYIIYFISILIYIKIYSLIINRNEKNLFLLQSVNRNYSINDFYLSINKSINIILNVAGVMVFFNIIKQTFSFYINYFDLNYFSLKFILSFIEVSSGLKDISLYNNINLNILLLSSQGLCILIQSLSYLNKKNISFLRYILNHILSTIAVSCIFITLSFIFHI